MKTNSTLQPNAELIGLLNPADLSPFCYSINEHAPQWEHGATDLFFQLACNDTTLIQMLLVQAKMYDISEVEDKAQAQLDQLFPKWRSLSNWYIQAALFLEMRDRFSALMQTAQSSEKRQDIIATCNSVLDYLGQIFALNTKKLKAASKLLFLQAGLAAMSEGNKELQELHLACCGILYHAAFCSAEWGYFDLTNQKPANLFAPLFGDWWAGELKWQKKTNLELALEGCRPMLQELHQPQSKTDQ